LTLAQHDPGMLLGLQPKKGSDSTKLSVAVAGHQQGIQSFSGAFVVSMERTGSLGDELLKPATGTRAVHEIVPSPGVWALG